MKSLELSPINEFYSSKTIALVGISTVKSKFGNYIFKQLVKRGYSVLPIHASLGSYEGKEVFKSIADLPEHTDAILINTRPTSSRLLVQQAIDKGIKKIWLQPGSDDEKTLVDLPVGDAQVITGQCAIMFLEKPGFPHNLHRYFHMRKSRVASVN